MTAPVTPQPSAGSSNGGGVFFICGFLIAALVAGGFVFTRSADRANPKSAPEEVKLREAVPDSVKPVPASNTPGLHNVFRLGKTLYTGSSPDEEGSFATLSRLGIKTIISVDGAPPDVEAARAAGMRYVHLPITYTSVPRETLIGLVRATKELPGPIYLHCHHGKHRGPAAAVALWRCQDPRVTNDQAFATLTWIGTADKYQGLFASVRDIVVPSTEELTAAKSDLPESTHVPPLAKSMAEIDRMWDRVATPAKDRNTTTITLQLTTTYDIAEHFREAARLADVVDQMQPEFRKIEEDLEALADVIKQELRDPAVTNPHRAEAVTRVKNRCDECHAAFRN